MNEDSEVHISQARVVKGEYNPTSSLLDIGAASFSFFSAGLLHFIYTPIALQTLVASLS
jgi:hypothetical protein